jgi:hypothetical protein
MIETVRAIIEGGLTKLNKELRNIRFVNAFVNIPILRILEVLMTNFQSICLIMTFLFKITIFSTQYKIEDPTIPNTVIPGMIGE